ncbi:MAG: RNA polymerase sigma factor [Ruminococcus sp.]|nr:RNA polymerase sigma factor [Ruminococcus sp.]
MEDREKYFSELYERTKKQIYDFIAAKCFNVSDADDIFQNTYVEVLRSLDRLPSPPQNEEAFVTLIAKRQLTRHYSAVRRLRERIALRDPEDDLSDIPDSFSIEDDLDIRTTAEEIRSFLEQKPLVTRKVFFLYYRRGLTISETASLLGITESSVKAKLYRTLYEIRRKYGKEE